MEPWAPLVWDFGSTPSPKGSVPSILTCLGAKLRARVGTPHIPYMDINVVQELPYDRALWARLVKDVEIHE